jgi:hypothetical protein
MGVGSINSIAPIERLSAFYIMFIGSVPSTPIRFLTISNTIYAREGECELGTLAIGKTVSRTYFGDRMGVDIASSRFFRSVVQYAHARGLRAHLLIAAQILPQKQET